MPNHVEGDDLALDTALPRLSEFGSQLLVPFTVNRLPRPSVLWLNCRWFRRQGLCVAPNTTSRRQVETILLDNFAYLVAAQKGDDGLSGSKVVFADRYGDPGGLSPHGGSGRVANIGRFQIKGIGPTPLVGTATWMHSHGMVTIDEAVCEAIFAELMNAELPYGSAPVIAIVDTGELVPPSYEGDENTRDAYFGTQSRGFGIRCLRFK